MTAAVNGFWGLKIYSEASGKEGKMTKEGLFKK